ncbi:MAG: pyridoxal-phosphate dependent enzyme, partial [Melioribacteraceae bacterium]
CGLECHLALGGEEPESYSGNLLLDKLFDAKIHWCGEFRKGEKIPEIYSELQREGKKPYIIPYGGSNSTGALGFVEAVKEIKSQSDQKKIKIDRVIFASSSGGTHSGLLAGNELYKFDAKMTGIRIDKSEDDVIPYDRQVLELSNELAAGLELNKRFTMDDVILRGEFMGDGYGVVGNLERSAIKLLAAKEGILLDPVYTGRVFGAMVKMIEDKEFSGDENILFWHTGGTPALFSYSGELL